MTERLEILYKSDEIKQRTGRVAREIAARFQPGGDFDDTPLFIALLKGGAPFATDLMRELTQQYPNMHPELEYMATSRYPTGENPIGEAEIVVDIAPEKVKNRNVVVVDDVLDMGDTYHKVREHLLGLGARYIALAVLVEKDIQRQNGIEADFVGFKDVTGWLVGYGMNDGATAPEAYRWADYIARIAPGDTPDTPPQLASV